MITEQQATHERSSIGWRRHVVGVGLVLLYGALASLPILPQPLPLLGSWQPQMTTVVGADTSYQWQGGMLLLMGGAMTAAAVWRWWRHARD